MFFVPILGTFSFIGGAVLNRDPFSQYHPLVNFLYFVGVILFSVVIQHPAYLAVSVIAGLIYYLILKGRKALPLILGLIPVFLVIAAVNPIFNTLGNTVLFSIISRPYTLEALLHGMAMGGIFAAMMLWFGCYSEVLTSDKFTSLFGRIIPSLSLLLVMVLRLIPNLMRKARQITAARVCIGKGLRKEAGKKEQLTSGVAILSGLTDWALEGSIVTADSMRARGYGSSKRTTYQQYRLRTRDLVMLSICAVLILFIIVCGGIDAQYTPDVIISPLTPGFAGYCIFLLIPSMLYGKETLTWQLLRSKI